MYMNRLSSDNIDFDLDLNHYTFDELLKLFQIDELNAKTVKVAYKFAMMTHPDKSALHKKYFIFFSKAFKLLKRVYDSTKSGSSEPTIIHTDDKISETEISNFKNQDNFHVHFNRVFNTLHKNEHDEDNFGYSEWLKQNKDEIHSINSITQLHEFIENKKELVHYNQTEISIVSNPHYSLSRKKPDNYDAEVFAKLPYQDLKKACIDIIPTKQIDSRSNMSYQHYVTNRDVDFKTYKDNSKYYIKQKQFEENEENVHTVFELSKQMENTKKNQQIWLSYITRIKNDF